METINVILDSEYKHYRLTKFSKITEKHDSIIMTRKIKYLFPSYNIKYKKIEDIDNIKNWIFPLELAFLEGITNIKDFMSLLPNVVLKQFLDKKGTLLFIIRDNILDTDIQLIQESIPKDSYMLKHVLFLSTHKDQGNFKHWTTFPHHVDSFSVDNRSITINSNSSCEFIGNYDKRYFCCFLQNYADGPERKYLLSFLEKYKLLDKGFVSAKNYAKDFYNPKRKGGYFFSSHSSVFNDLDIGSTLNNSFLNIIPEGSFTHRTSQYVTEKVLRSFIYKKPFILINRQYDLKYIQSMGYKTFSPIINESYDSIYDHASRLVAIQKEIKRLLDKPFSEFKKDMEQLEDICNYNYDTYLNNKNKLEKYLYDRITKNY